MCLLLIYSLEIRALSVYFTVFMKTRAFQVIERTCVEVTGIQPCQLCQNRNATDIRLQGRGFTINLNRNKAQCRFLTDAGPISECVPSLVSMLRYVTCHVYCT